jgi:hypothetical protein
MINKLENHPNFLIFINAKNLKERVSIKAEHFRIPQEAYGY